MCLSLQHFSYPEINAILNITRITNSLAICRAYDCSSSNVPIELNLLAEITTELAISNCDALMAEKG